MMHFTCKTWQDIKLEYLIYLSVEGCNFKAFRVKWLELEVEELLSCTQWDEFQILISLTASYDSYNSHLPAHTPISPNPFILPRPSQEHHCASSAMKVEMKS